MKTAVVENGEHGVQDLPAYAVKVRDFYETTPQKKTRAARCYRKILARYYQHLIPAEASILEIGCGDGELLSRLPNTDITGVDLSPTLLARARKRIPHGTFHEMAGERLKLGRTFDYIIVSDTANELGDVQAFLEAARSAARPDTRLILNFYNNLWRPGLSLLTRLGLRRKQPPLSWLSDTDMLNLLKLAGWEVIRQENKILFPCCVPLLEGFLNRLSPLAPWFGLSVFQVARLEPQQVETQRPRPSVSVVVPARNEAGNIEAAVRRTPEMGEFTELIFIEGNSTDDTWDTIQKVAAAHPERRIRTMRQTGKGKGNAVREAFAAAEGDVLMILDADLTMPPEDLPKFYEALTSGRGEFVNGVRLVYPMEDEAMRFLNMCANKLFGVLFSWMLSQPVKDTLCGTKVLYKTDYERIAANRSYFGDFDPFGDFDLLFGAARLNMKITDLPIRYRNREYGSTNISRFRHGIMLFKMVAYASMKLKFI